MKKLLLFVAVVSAFSFASCKKDRTCTCVTSYTGGGAGTSTRVDKKVTKSTEKKICHDYDTKDSTGKVTATTTCSIS